MLHESRKVKELKITKDSIKFEDFYSKDYFPKKLELEIKKANFLILPFENFGGANQSVFPEDTRNFFMFIKKKRRQILNY